MKGAELSPGLVLTPQAHPLLFSHRPAFPRAGISPAPGYFFAATAAVEKMVMSASTTSTHSTLNLSLRLKKLDLHPGEGKVSTPGLTEIFGL